MFESLVIVTREGVEAALVVAIVLAYLRRTGRTQYKPWVFAGVGVALLLSGVGAWWIPTLTVSAELVEGWALLIGAICVVTLIIWMVRAGKHMKAEIEGGLEKLEERSAGMGWGLAVFVALMLFREGVETILFLTAISFNTQGLERLVGALLGLGIAVLFGFLFVRGTLRVDLRRFFAVTTVVLGILAVQLLIGAYHEFAEAGVAPANRTSMAVVGPVVRYDSILFAIAVLLTLFVMSGNKKTGPALTGSENPAEKRKIMSRTRRDLTIRRLTTAAAAAVGVILFTGFITQARVPAKQAGTPVEIVDGAAHIPVVEVDDGDIHFFSVDLDERTVRFFAIKRPQGDLAICLDACLICGDIGYYQEAGGVICRNCTAPINTRTLGQSGGCNPIPLPSQVRSGEVVVSVDDLAAGARHFTASPE